MRLLDLLKRNRARYQVVRPFRYRGRIVLPGEVVNVSDPAEARELVGAGKAEPLDVRAEEHLREPARWTAPRTTAISPTKPGVFSRKPTWPQI